MNLEKLRYPIGKFEHQGEIMKSEIEQWIRDIEKLPQQLRTAVQQLTDEQLDTPYRPDRWSIRQVIQHLAASHINSIIRFKWALTEDTPTIKPHFEDRWAELPDYTQVPLKSILQFIERLHERWCILLKSLGQKELGKAFYHPESKQKVRLDWNIGMYA